MIDSSATSERRSTQADPAQLAASCTEALDLGVRYDAGGAGASRDHPTRVWLVSVSEGGLEPPRPLKGTSTSS